MRLTRLTVNLREYGEKEIPIKFSEDRFVVEKNEWVEGEIRITEMNQVMMVYLDVKCIRNPYNFFRAFAQEHSLTIGLAIKDGCSRALAIRRHSPFWTEPVFLPGEKSVEHIQQFLCQSGSGYKHLMPLCDGAVYSEISYQEGERDTTPELNVDVSALCGGEEVLKGWVCLVGHGTDPYETVADTYRAAVGEGLIETPLRENKAYPKELEGLGWCTWNAFYHEVTEQGIEEKLKEFQEKGIPISWVIIDDGWSVVKEFKLQSFEEDRRKFPSGLKNFIRRIKNVYGVRYVGVWHAFTGYWMGIDKESSLWQSQKENLEETNAGLWVPSGDTGKAYQFYCTWHRYLKEQGVDFLKVDAQGNALEFYRGMKNAASKVIAMHHALERSVEEWFGGAMINCMGLGHLDAYHRNYSSMVRNSDDFFPERENGFKAHIEQNAYNAVFNSQLYYCDFDMWWTRHFSAEQSCVLRAISGGPIYVSDKVGETESEYLRRFLNPDGSVTRYDDVAKPTPDCLFGYDNVLKLFNRCVDHEVIAAFDLSDGSVDVETRSKR